MTTAPSHPARPQVVAGDGAAAPVAPAPPAAAAPLSADERLLNRDFSWLRFNARVLRQATDERTPLLARVRFMAIHASNLDEFVMKRMSRLRVLVRSGVQVATPEGVPPRDILNACREEILRQQAGLDALYATAIAPELRRAGIELVSVKEVTPPELAWLDVWHRERVFPILTPLAVDPGHPFPFISSLSTSLGVMMKPAGRAIEEGEELFARVKAPASLPRWIEIPKEVTPGPARRFVPLEDVIEQNLPSLFPGMEILEVEPFRVTRSIEVARSDEDDTEDLMDSIEEELKQRRFAPPIRLEISAGPARRLQGLLIDELGLGPEDVYVRNGPLEYSGLFEIAAAGPRELDYAPWSGVTPARLADPEADIFAVIRQGDLLVHHPYESFASSVERFIAAAARDSRVLAIKQTLYRTSHDSPFVEDLIYAAEAGKQVACMVELRARLDEFRNIQVAQRLERAGVHVAYGVVGLKTHCKLALIVRQETDGLRCYGHIGTGNYNSKTALLYTDLSLLTCDPVVMGDMVQLFNSMTGRAGPIDYRALLVAPHAMRRRFNELIDREIAVARAGGQGRIVAKMNQLEDRQIAERLYEASGAGVRISLMVRGFCCVRPGVPGLSENISVMSSIGRFLEHSRIFHFGAGAADPLDGEFFIGSADWMYRNLNNRVEAIAPVFNRDARRRLWDILTSELQDARCGWDMGPDGAYTQRCVPPGGDGAGIESTGIFEWFMRDAAARRAASPMTPDLPVR